MQTWLPLTAAQSSVFHHQCHNEGNPFYNVGGYIRLESPDIDRLREAHAQLIKTFEVFGLRIVINDQGAHQVSVPPANTGLPVVDLSGEEHPESAAQAWLDTLFSTYIPLENNKLYRASLLRLSKDLYFYVGMGHHIALDGVGFVNWARALAKFYEKPTGDCRASITEARNAALVERDRAYHDSERYSKDRSYWKDKLRRFNHGLFPEPACAAPELYTKSARKIFPVSPGLHSKLMKLSGAAGVDRHQLMLAILAIYFSQAYSSNSIVFGTPLHGRKSEGERNKIGLLTRMMPLLIEVDSSDNLSGVLGRIRRSQRELLRHRNFSVVEVASDQGNPRPKDRLFDMGYSYLPVGGDPLFDGRPGKLVYCSHQHEQLPLLVTYWDTEGADGTAFFFDYNLDYFSASEVDEILSRLLHILDQLLESVDCPLEQLDLVTADEKRRLLALARENMSETDFRFNLADQLAEQFATNPGAVALEGDFGAIHYGELEHRVNTIASRFSSRYGVAGGDRVAVLMPRSPELVVVLLALIRLGAVYVPIDPQSPSARTRHILTNSEACLVVTNEGCTPPPKELVSAFKWAFIEQLKGSASPVRGDESSSTVLPTVVPGSSEPLYILYTSGSTGVPKGVLISRGSVENLLGGLSRRLNISSGERWLFVSSVAFDISVVEWLGSLALGNTCVIPPESQFSDPFAMAGLLNAAGITSLQTTPSRLKQLLSAGWRPENLRRVISAGEPLTAELAQRLLGCGVELWNGYGPTEATVYSLVKQVHAGESEESQASIGAQLPHYCHYVVNKNLGLIPPGIPGELVVAGAGLAIGYINRPELTASQFTVSSRLPETRLYRTGDIVRQLDGGRFQYLGRNDDQVKLRGYRIELSEIQAAIQKVHSVRDAVVVHRKPEGGSPAQLIAYVCLESEIADVGVGQDVSAQIRRELLGTLPSYMVPSAIAVIDELPINTNGKVEKHRLPALDSRQAEQLVPLESENEKLIGEIWSEVLDKPVTALGRESDFFALGGDSILAVKMVARLRQATRRNIGISDLFLYTRLRDLAEHLDVLSARETPVTIPRVARGEAAYPASVIQRQIWYVSTQNASSSHYNMAVSYQVLGSLLPSLVDQAIRILLDRYEILRTVYRSIDGGLVQVVLPSPNFKMESIDGSSWADNEKNSLINEAVARNANWHFNLEEDIPFRASLLGLGSEQSVLMFCVHHIAVDGWSIRILVGEFLKIYESLAAGRLPQLPEVECQYLDFTEWQQSALKHGAWDNQVAYWESILDEVPQTHALSLDFPRPKLKGSRGQQVEKDIDQALRGRLQLLARELGVTEFSLLQSVFALLVCKWSYSEEVVIGSPALGRGSIQLESSVGMFVNLLAYVHHFRPEESLSDYFVRFQRDSATALENQDIPFERIVEAVRPQRDPSHHPIFQLLFAFQDDLPSQMDTAGIRFLRLPEEASVTKFDLELLVTRYDDQWSCRWIFDPELFDCNSVSALASAYVSLLERVTDAPECNVWQVALPQAALPSAFDSSSTVPVQGAHQLVEIQTAQLPEKIAVSYGDQNATYEQLNERANRLARVLLARRVQPGSFVALNLPRGLELITATLAVLKAGCAYVPVDPSYPVVRQSYILSDVEPACVLTTMALAVQNADTLEGQSLVCLDDPVVNEEMEAATADNISLAQVELSEESIAYVIYTSGSTGKPKGVMLAHGGLINLAVAQSRAFSITQSSKVLQFASFSFDAAVSEWSTTLASGATLVMVPEDIVPDMAALTDWAVDHQVTHATLPPVVLKRLEPTAWSALTHVISAGEAISLEEARRWSSHCKFINAYGPTESTVCASIGGINEMAGRVSIGSAMGGIALHVLDRGLRPVAPGAVGELCISGVGLAKGYLNKPELTNAAFVPLALEEGQSIVVYRTGDRVRQLLDGDLIFEGRIDEQVKIRGHRVECAEVEKCIAAHPLIKEVSVCTRENADSETILAAYIVSDVDGSESKRALIDDLRRQLAVELPAYMIPALILAIDALTLTQNGKIDKRKLSALEAAEPGVSAKKNVTSTEEAVRDIWVSLLGPVACDVDCGFFELGGHSLLVSDVLTKIASVLGVKLSYRQFFENATIAGLAKFIDVNREGLERSDLNEVRRVAAPGGSYPLSFEQRRIWFIDQMEQGSSHYNMPVALRLRGDVDPELIEAALRQILMRHESLRTVFAVDKSGEPIQIVKEDFFLKLDLIQFDGGCQEEFIREQGRAERKKPFDLKRDLLLRAKLQPLSEKEAVLFLTMHHIAVDGWSVDRLVTEFGEIYTALQEGREHLLPPLRMQYKEYAREQRRMEESDAYRDGIAFWRKYLGGAPQCHTLPLDYARPENPSLNGRCWTALLPVRLSDQLKELSRKSDTTLFVTLQAAFSLAVARWSENRDILVGTPVANRHRPEISDSIGFFVNTLVLRTDCTENRHFSELLRQSRDEFLDVFEHQQIPFDVLVDELTASRNLAYYPLIQILFSLQEDPTRKLEKLNVPALSINVLDEDDERPVKFDLELMVSDGEDGLTCQWTFDASLFAEETIRRLFDSYLLILEAVAENPDCRIHEMEVISDIERKKLLAPSRSLPEKFATGGILCERFERVARARGDTLAVIHGARRLTYAELDTRSTQLANWLIANGFVSGRPIAVYMERGIELVVAIMAIVKTGTPYLPLDLGYPEQRVGYILEDSNAALLLTDRGALSNFHEGIPKIDSRCMDDAEFILEYQQSPDEFSLLHESRRLTEEGLVYVVYTSGSTGVPKGVMVRQESFLNLVLWYFHDYAFDERDRCLLIGSIGFDMTQKNLFAPLLAGAALIIPDEYFDPVVISALTAEHQVTVINCAPSAAYQLVEPKENWPQLSSLRLLALGGEAIRLGPLRSWLMSQDCHARVLNMYGPSECTDIAVAGDYDRHEAAGHTATLPIGRPIYNCSAYVLNEQMKLQPRGVVGELFIGGVGVSNGYINRDDLTHESFLDNVIPGLGRLYRTGDLVRMDNCDCYHYVGRVDQQVKIRGYRVETAEIDSVIAEFPEVRQVVTIAVEHDGEEKILVSFVVLDVSDISDNEITKEVFMRIRSEVSDKLPGFMMPNKFILLDSIPLTPNGKFDKRRLTSEMIGYAGWQFTRELRSPRNATEERLRSIWIELLHRDDVSIDDNFFELGGNSLLVTRLASQIGKVFEFDETSISVKEFFQNPTIEMTARIIDAKVSYEKLLSKEKSLLESSSDIEEGSF